MKKLKLKYKLNTWRGVYEVFKENENGELSKTLFFIYAVAQWSTILIKKKYLYVAAFHSGNGIKRIGISRKSVGSAVTEIKKYIKENNLYEKI